MYHQNYKSSADDITILRSGKDLQLRVTKMTIELEKLIHWYNKNKLSLNI